MSSSQCEMVHEQRPVMSADLFLAAMKGKEDVLIQRLGLLEEQKEVTVTIEHQIVQSELVSATRFGDTVLHLLVTKRHNELALKVFQRDKSLLKVQNKMLETPLHCAAKVGNEEVITNLILIDAAIVKDALEETNENGDTALHVAVRYESRDICIKLMELDPEVAYKVNNEMLSPFYLAIDEKHDFIAKKMLQVDPILAGTQFSNGMFPVHLATRKNNWMMVQHFMVNYPDYVELVDPRGRNLFHIAAEEDKKLFFFSVSSSRGYMEVRMNNATDYDGNTPMHIAAMKGHRIIMRDIWENKMNRVAEAVRNKRGLTPYEVSKRQLQENTNEDPTITPRIIMYEVTNGQKFSEEWFHSVMVPIPPVSSLTNIWERTQVIGLGSVLITTVTFAASFTIPGGYNQNDGTPLLGRRYVFRAYILANSLAFIQGFLSLFALLTTSVSEDTEGAIPFATSAFLLAASCMIVAFGLGLYVTLAPVCLPIAIFLLVITLFLGTPAVFRVTLGGQNYFRRDYDFTRTGNVVLASYAMAFLLIFCLAFM